MLQFKASVHKVSTDREGEVTVTLKVPMVCRNEAISLSILTEEVLDVTVQKQTVKKQKELTDVSESERKTHDE